jgi:hypothetical protein
VDQRGDAWWFSTPAGKNGFWQLYNRGLDKLRHPDWRSWHFTSYDNPHIPASELDEMRQTMTERAYRQEILADFLDNEGQVFRNIDACLHAPPPSQEQHRGHNIVAGVDWGKQQDFTVIAAGCATCKTELVLDRFNQIDYSFQRQRLMGLYHTWSVGHSIGELNAMGEPVIEQLQRDGIRITGYQTTLTGKIAIIEGLALALEQGQVQLLPDAVGRAELEAYEVKLTKTGMSTYSAPEGMHDDTVIARALMWRAMQQAPATSQPDPRYTRQWDKLQEIL